MEKSKKYTILFLLTLGLLAPIVLAKSPPMVISTSPAAYANDVSSELKEITITFDQPMMDESWSWTGGGETYPQLTGKPYYNETKTICTLPVKLEPGKVYKVGINSPSHKNFKTPDRTPAPWYIILFATKNEDGSPISFPQDLLAKTKSINNQSQLQKTDTDGEDGLAISFYSPNVSDPEELLKLFNLNHPSDAQTHQYSTKLQDGELIGTIYAKTVQDKAKIIQMIKVSPYLKLSESEKAFEVVSRINANNEKFDKTDYPFVKDSKAIGKWGTIDLVRAIEQFQLGEKQFPDELFLKELIFEDRGKAKEKVSEKQIEMTLKWTNGLVLDKESRTASRYIIKNLDGKDYMFFEWKCDDYTVRHMEPVYYVLERLSFGDTNKAEAAAVKSAMLWLSLIDRGDYGRSWEKAAELLKNNVTKTQLSTSLESARKPLGKLISREVVSTTYAQQLPGTPQGEYVVITFKTTFENKISATETVTPMLEQGRWRVSGYFIK